MLGVGDNAPKFEFEDQDGKKYLFPDGFKGKWLALFFLRHLGCPLCMEKLNALKGNFKQYRDSGIDLCVVVQSTPRRVTEYARDKGIPFHLIADHDKVFYDLYGVKRGGIGAFLAPSVMLASVRSTLKGNFHGKFEGDELQKPAAFLVDTQGKIVFADYGKNIADIVGEDEIFKMFNQLKQGKGK